MSRAVEPIFSPAIFTATPVVARQQLDEWMRTLPAISSLLADIGEDLPAEARRHVRETYGWTAWLAVARRLQSVAAATAKRTQKRRFLALRESGVSVEDAKAMSEVSEIVEEVIGEHTILSEYVDRIGGFLEAGRTRRDMMKELFAQGRHEDH